MGMQPLLRMMLVLWLGLAGVAAQAAEAENSEAMGKMLLSMSGTAQVFASPRLQAALQDATSYKLSFGRGFDGRRLERLLHEAGFNVWRDRPRLWVLLGTAGSWQNLAQSEAFVEQAGSRGLLLVKADPSASVQEEINRIMAGDDARLPALLRAQEVEALVLLKPNATGASWQFIQPGRRLSGEQAGQELASHLPHILGESLAATVQWPEAYGRSLVAVQGVGSLPELMAVQAALSQLPALKGVSLVRVAGRTAYFAVDAQPNAVLRQALAAEPRLQEDAAAYARLPALLRLGLEQGSPLHIRTWAPLPSSTQP